MKEITEISYEIYYLVAHAQTHTHTHTLTFLYLIYSFSILPNAPEFFFSNLQRMFFEFLWNNKGDKLTRSILYNDYLEGGLKMPHVYSFNNAIKVAWVKKILICRSP